MAGGAKSHRLRRALCVFLTLLALVLIGTVVVLSTVVQYFGVDKRDIITEPEMLIAEQWALQQAQGRAQAALSAQRVSDTPTWQNKADEQLDEDIEFDNNIDGVVSEAIEPAFDNGGNSDDRAPPPRQQQRRSNPEAAPARRSEPTQRIPKIIHQTWKTDTLPDRWKQVRQTCIDLHPDYEYMLWSDDSSREFIAREYPWFLATFDGYTYPIQRADAIRYFVLHHYGGVYMDLDIGCRRNMDPLLSFQIILPATIPVGVSNDLMFAEKQHPFMDLVIHNLVTFDHSYGTNYPTVMFSTGPMFLSAQYGLWPKEDVVGEDRQVRVLPRRWYGKNAPDTEMQDSFFDHYYGSSWHADDAGFITFLGKFGMVLMYLGFSIVILGVARLLWSKRSVLRAKSHRAMGPISLPSAAAAAANNLPFARPGSPSDTDGLLDGSKSPLSRATTPGRGVLYYLPVWFFPPESGSRTPMPTNSSQAGNWSQYFSNVSFIDDGTGQSRYQPVPDFSRPSSPSNNSILHAPGSVHDGAFDGVQLHSINGQPAFVPASSSGHRHAMTSPPTSPNPPPSYSSLKSWGSQFFRSPRTAFLSLGSTSNNQGSCGRHFNNSDTDDDDLERGKRTYSTDDVFANHRQSRDSSALGFTLGRPRSPLPQYRQRQSTDGDGRRSTSPTEPYESDVKHFNATLDDPRSRSDNVVRSITMARSLSSSESESGRRSKLSRRGSSQQQATERRTDAGRESVSSTIKGTTDQRRIETTSSDFDDRRGSLPTPRPINDGRRFDGLVVPNSPEGSVATTIESFNTAEDTYEDDDDNDWDAGSQGQQFEDGWFEGRAVEDEVDRLLTEMSAPTTSSLDEQRRRS
ncbi:hypothetical protein OIO90_001254 [Microbotryomycetes sp. JL221]|nr:hypothetical protein OIO90_001254 [Microbotryomycetes sp. JL221]